jgi:hypothetical protein
MGLDDLVGCIEVLKERMRSYRAALEENETRTRMALIDPLLCALGWDVSDPGVVAPEYRVGGGWADYALLRPDGEPAATLEAKKLGESLVAHRMQMLNYANMAGIKYAGLTDGNHWELYKVFEPGRLEDRQILEVSIADAPAHESVLKLLLLWRPNLTSGQPVAANTPVVENHPLAPTPTQVEQASTPPAAASDWVALSEYNPPPGQRSPVAIRFWDDSERTLTHWNEVLTYVVEKLYTEKKLTVETLPIGWSKQTHSVHIEPTHPTGKAFGKSKRIEGTPLFVNVNLNAAQFRQNTKRLLEHHGLDPADVHLRKAH